MSREEQIKNAAINYKMQFPEGYVNELDYIEGANWADNNPRTDIIGVDSISFIRRILESKFHEIGRKYHDVMIGDVPEMKQALDMIVNFDEACKSVGYMFDDENGIYVMK